MHKLLKLMMVVLLGVTLCACQGFGSRELPQNRQGYNQALQQSANQQLLLNIVRLHYGDTPYFVVVSSISSQMTFRSQVGSSYEHYYEKQTTSSVRRTLRNIVDVSPSVTFESKPTIFYSPLQSREFSSKVLSPAALREMYLLLRSGWSMARVMRVGLQRLGPYVNAPSASRPTSRHVPKYKDFIELVYLIREIQRHDNLSISFVRLKDSVPAIRIQFLGVADKDKVVAINRLLNLDEDNDVLYLVDSPEDFSKPNVLHVETRSFMGMMYYAAKGVDTPPEAVEQGLVSVTKFKNGQLFDWQEVVGGMLHVHYGEQEPANALVSVRYRGMWYYILNNDHDSKSTMAMLYQLYELQSSAIEINAPMVSLST